MEIGKFTSNLQLRNTVWNNAFKNKKEIKIIISCTLRMSGNRHQIHSREMQLESDKNNIIVHGDDVGKSTLIYHREIQLKNVAANGE